MPDPRNAALQAFLSRAGWGHATRTTIAGDASNRRYDRLIDAETGAKAVVMDAPPEKGEDVRPFVRVTGLLRARGLSAPKVIAEDAEHGFLLLEDLGDDLFARLLEKRPAAEAELYEAAIDVLVHLHAGPQPDLPRYGAVVMTPLACLAFDWYAPAGRDVAQAREAFAHACLNALSALDHAHPVLVHRDYHAENLLWLPRRAGVARVGLLDYQDAMLGHPAYDLVSILQDARRDVPPRLAEAMTIRYLSQSGQDEAEFRLAYALLGMQRTMRILGVFARLSLAYRKPHYVDLIPRVWDHLITNLDHPALHDIAPLIRDALPAPYAAHLADLKSQSGSRAT